METSKKFLMFQETSYVSGSNFPSLKNEKKPSKKCLIFQEMELCSPKPKKFAKPENQKFHIFCLLRENFLNITAKEKKFLILSFEKKQKFLNQNTFL